MLWFWALRSFARFRNLPWLFIKIIFLLLLFPGIEILTSWQFSMFTISHMAHHTSSVIWLNVIIYLIITLLLLAVFFTRQWIQHERQERELIESQLSTELNFLRSQINPHFLFNTLNNLFSIAQRDHHDDLSAGISKLSGLMRYMLYDSRVSVVPLSKEIAYIEDFIGLSQLRFSEEEVLVEFYRTRAPGSQTIAPMILLPFIENAFKHGVVAEEKSTIRISLEAENGKVTFECENPKKTVLWQDGLSQGIGLENVRRRLVLLYPGRHTLEIDDNEKYYRINLTLTS